MKRLFTRAGLVLLGAVIALASLELGARLIHPTPDAGSFYRLDEITGWAHSPGAEGWYLGTRSGEFKVWVRINSRGLRDREVPYARNKTTFRILALGDSFTAGLQVPLEETFPKVLERMLNQNRAGQRYEVINAGVNGYGTDNEVLFYRHEGAKYQPNLVLLALYFANDVVENYREFASPLANYNKPYFVLEGDSLRLRDFPYRLSFGQRLKSQVDWRLSQLKIYRFGSQMWNIMMAGLRDRPLAVTRAAQAHNETWTQQWERGWTVTRLLLQELRREVEKAGAALVVVLMPPADAVDLDYWEKAKHVKRRPDLWLDPIKHEAILTDLLQQDGFRFVRLLPVLKEGFDHNQLPYFDYDLHWNANGHRIASDAILKYLVEESLVPGAIPDRLRP